MSTNYSLESSPPSSVLFANGIGARLEAILSTTSPMFNGICIAGHHSDASCTCVFGSDGGARPSIWGGCYWIQHAGTPRLHAAREKWRRCEKRDGGNRAGRAAGRERQWRSPGEIKRCRSRSGELDNCRGTAEMRACCASG
jgi:hypothetical protein